MRSAEVRVYREFPGPRARQVEDLLFPGVVAGGRPFLAFVAADIRHDALALRDQIDDAPVHVGQAVSEVFQAHAGLIGASHGKAGLLPPRLRLGKQPVVGLKSSCQYSGPDRLRSAEIDKP